MIPKLPSMPAVSTYHWTGHYAENRRPVLGDVLDWQKEMEDGREAALMDVLVKQFDQWGPERTRRVLAYLVARYTGVDKPPDQA